VTAQSLAISVLHPQTELNTEPQHLRQIEARSANPADEVPSLHELKHDVRLPFENLDSVGLNNIRMLSKLYP
jgi:hypothetical protein